MGLQWMERNRCIRPPFSEWASLDIKGDCDEDTGALLRLHVVARCPVSGLEPDFVGSLEFYRIDEVPCKYFGRWKLYEHGADQRTRYESGRIAIKQ